MDKKRFWKYLTVVIVGMLTISILPEVVALGLFIDAVGMDIFILMIQAQIGVIFIGFYSCWLKPILTRINNFLYRKDPYYFIPSKAHIKKYPLIVMHMVPFAVAINMLVFVGM